MSEVKFLRGALIGMICVWLITAVSFVWLWNQYDHTYTECVIEYAEE